MEIIKNKEKLKSRIQYLKNKKKTISFIPTMGSLHDGHLALVNKSLYENYCTVCSIFLNPLQFNNKLDLVNYPKSIENDIQLLKNISCDIVFIPTYDDLFPKKYIFKSYDFDTIENVMEGKRPNHFQGVAKIISRFFDIISPDYIYLGEKDYQQILIIKKLIEIEKFSVKIITCETIRNEKGLALSSRNQRLLKEDQEKATFIYKQLQWVKKNYFQYSVTEIYRIVKDAFVKSDLELEYIFIFDDNTFKEVKNNLQIDSPRVYIAAYISGVRLIDNISLCNSK